MNTRQPQNLRERVVQAATQVLERSGTVGPIELLQQMRFLDAVHVEAWRKGSEYATPLEGQIQCGEKKLQQTYQYFHEWAKQQDLRPIEASYVRSGPRGNEPLRITTDGDPEREQYFRTHYAPAGLSESKTKRLEQKLSKPPDLVVFQLVSQSAQCSECQQELFKDNLLCMERRQPLCLSCADMDHLEFLPSGDAALTRRARKYSPLSAIVVRFIRARKRYERQGILVTEEAVARAESECAADADERAERRRRDAIRRRDEDHELVAAMTQIIVAEFPKCPADEARRLAEHTASRGSGRVGRSAAGRALEPAAIQLAVVAWIRHNHTQYDSLLMRGTERQTAREMVRSKIQRVLADWSEG